MNKSLLDTLIFLFDLFYIFRSEKYVVRFLGLLTFSYTEIFSVDSYR